MPSQIRAFKGRAENSRSPDSSDHEYPLAIPAPRLRTVSLWGTIAQEHESVEMTKDFFKLIFFIEDRKKVISLLAAATWWSPVHERRRVHRASSLRQCVCVSQAGRSREGTKYCFNRRSFVTRQSKFMYPFWKVLAGGWAGDMSPCLFHFVQDCRTISIYFASLS